MAHSIKDGTGDCYEAKVDVDKRLHTRAVTASEILAATIEGDAYIAGSGIVEITNDTDNYLLYVSNDSELDLVIEETSVVTGVSTGGASNEVTFLGRINPTGGTIVTGGTVFSPFNLNLSSARKFNGVAHVAPSLGYTATGGIPASGFVHGTGRHIFTSRFILPRGSSLTGGFKCATGNTSMTVSMGYTIYFRNPEIV